MCISVKLFQGRTEMYEVKHTKYEILKTGTNFKKIAVKQRIKFYNLNLWMKVSKRHEQLKSKVQH